MRPTDENKAGVIGVLSRAKEYNPDLGNYEEHFYNEQFGFSVRLSNEMGIKMSREIAQDQEVSPQSVSEDRIKKVAASAWKLSK